MMQVGLQAWWLLYNEVVEYANNRCGSIKTDEELKWVQDWVLEPMRKDPVNWMWYTIWLMYNDEQEIVVECGLKGPPNKYGEVEIGYYTMASHRGNEYATEAVELMVGWLKDQPNVRIACAAVKEDNTASIRVLQKNEFIYVGDNQLFQIWQKHIK